MSGKCKKPCSECAFKKDSAKGYMGGNPIELYFSFFDADMPVPCHMKSEANDEGVLENKGNTPCIGHLMAQVKSCKLPHSQESQGLIAQLRAQPNFEALKSAALAKWEFIPHHQKHDCK